MTHELTLYYEGGQWCYDDPAHGRVAEPLVLGASEVIDCLRTLQLGHKREERVPVVVHFGETLIAGAAVGTFVGQSVEQGELGSWYVIGTQRAWLCPALLDFFPTPPDELYVSLHECA